MSRRELLTFALLSLPLLAILAYFQRAPGYMDADYYYVTGRQLATGYGFTEPVIWNFLSDPSGLPQPSHAYWMPLASMLAAAGMWLSQNTSFGAARLGFLLVAVLVPPLTALLSMEITGRRDHARLAGLLALLPGLYLAYLGTTDTFGLAMLMGAVTLLLVGRIARLSSVSWQNSWLALALGVVAGLMHLGRADGFIWLALGLALPWADWLHPRRRAGFRWRSAWVLSSLVLLGYLLVFGPWILRNLSIFGVPFSPGAARAAWQTSYDELFVYPPQILTFERWISAGWRSLLADRLQAFGQNLQSAFAVQGEIFLAPLAVAGAWKCRADRRVQVGFAGWLAILGVMTLVFPYAGWRGGFFHSGATVQPLIWAISPVGLEVFIAWGSRVRRWNRRQATGFFSVGLLLLSFLLCGVGVARRVIGANLSAPAWNQPAQAYARLGLTLQALGFSQTDPVLVNNPPGFYAVNLQPAISIPDGDAQVAHRVALRYGARYMLLEGNHPVGLDALYRQPGSQAGWKYRTTVDETHIYELDAGP